MRRLIFVSILLAGLTACSSRSEQEPVLGEAFVGPATLQLREELTSRASLVETLHHGEKVDIIGRRRRFYKIRTKSDKEGWLDGRQLLSTRNMADLKKLAESAATAPSQGRATVFETMNVHTSANRQSPSFFQVTQQAQVDVIAHERAPRVPFEAPEFNDSAAVAAELRKGRRVERAQAGGERPAPPPPPAVPDNWLELSGHPDGVAPAKSKPAAPGGTVGGTPTDDWTLIRAADGRAGWVLGRMLLMSIPDEVAQLAERARIMAYFQIGTNSSHGMSKPVWLWATLADRNVDYDLDSLRIFVWNFRRHRYETSFIERNLRGYLPIRLHGGPNGEVSSFHVVVEEKNGPVVERTYTLQGYRARVSARKAAELPPTWLPASSGGDARRARAVQPDKSVGERVKGALKGLKGVFKR